MTTPVIPGSRVASISSGGGRRAVTYTLTRAAEPRRDPGLGWYRPRHLYLSLRRDGEGPWTNRPAYVRMHGPRRRWFGGYYRLADGNPLHWLNEALFLHDDTSTPRYSPPPAWLAGLIAKEEAAT